MKVAITGHTRGIGLGIKNYFESQGHEVVGLSKSNGYDISQPFTREKIVKLCENIDVFVNNAYYGDGSQLSLLKKIHTSWKDQNKTIINISTRFTFGKDLYNIHKKSIDEYCAEHIYNNPFILNIKPGLVDTDRVKNINNPKMSVEEVVSIIDWALKQPIKIHSITFGK